MWSYNYSTSADELYHHGVLGMKWGKRNAQNSDGSLSKSSQKRISKKYKKEAIKGDKALVKNYNDLYVKAYNKSANSANGLIEKFNSQQRKKYGENFSKRDGYETDYEKLFNDVLNKNLTKVLVEFSDSNKNYKKADALVKKYNMTKWDDLAKSNTNATNKARQLVNQ